MGFLTYDMELTDSTSSQGGAGNTRTHEQCSFAWDHADHHTEDVEINLGKEGRARVDINPAGWKVMSRWDRRQVEHKTCLVSLRWDSRENILGIHIVRAISSTFYRP